MYECQIERAMNSENLGSRIIKTELWIKKYGSGSFQGQNGLFKRFWQILKFLKWLEGFGTKDRGSCEIWEIFGDFCGFLEGLKWFRTYL
jgi:hypothetical protein